jgi:LPS-assembly protein
LTKSFKILWILLFLSLPLSSEAQGLGKHGATGPVDIVADNLEYNKKENLYTAKGHVEVKEGTSILNADYVEYHEDSADALAEGNVVLQDSENIIRTQRMTLNLLTQEGTIEKGDIYVKQGSFYILGEEIQKTGEATYVIQRGQFTTCGWDKPAWKFTAKNVNVTAKGYATASNAVFRILNQPVFFMPWGMFPLKTERESGFLLPELITSSRDGIKLTESYYWAMSRDKDATFGAQWIQARGVKPAAEFRYFISNELKGTWSASIIDDRDFGHYRYNIKGEHEQVITSSLTLKSKIDYVSDQDYLQDFGLTTLERSENSVKSTIFGEQSLKKSLLTAETTYFRTLVQKDNDQTFQALPLISFFTEYIPVFKNTFYADISSNVANYSREQGTSFSRLSAEPALRLPLHLKGFNFLTSTSLLERIYSINQKGSADPEQNGRQTETFQTVKVEGDANFLAVRNYQTDLFGMETAQSVIKPRVTYTYIPATNTADLPFEDPSDQISKTNTVTYSFNHYLNAISKNASREISLLEIDQTYSLSRNLAPSPLYIIGNGNNQGPGRRLSDIHTKLTLYPGRTFFLAQESYIDPYAGGAKILRNSLGIVQPKFNTTISHTYQAGDVSEGGINQVLWLSAGTYRDFDGRMSILYDLLDNSWISTLYAITYHPGCWSITLTLTQTRRPPDTSIHFSFNLLGITSRAQPAVPISPLTAPTPPVAASARRTYALQERTF